MPKEKIREVKVYPWSKRARDIRNPKTWHKAFAEHAGHDIYIKHSHNHTFMYCKTCRRNNTDHLFFKTWDNGQTPVGFTYKENEWSKTNKKQTKV